MKDYAVIQELEKCAGYDDAKLERVYRQTIDELDQYGISVVERPTDKFKHTFVLSSADAVIDRMLEIDRAVCIIACTRIGRRIMFNMYPYQEGEEPHKIVEKSKSF